VKWTPGTQNDDVDDERGNGGSSGGGGDSGGDGYRPRYSSGGGYSGGGGGFGWPHLSGGGIIILLLVVGAIKLFHIDVFGHSHTTTTPTSSSRFSSKPGSAGSAGPRTGPDPDAKLVDFVKFVMKDVQDTFEAMFKGGPDGPYRHAKLVLFTSSIATGCGQSSSSIGPFYCPPDEKAYIDLSFYKELRDRFGASGEFAEAYVLAHEIGHHIQKLIGLNVTRALMKDDKKTKLELSVRTELQADCYAGVWGHSANERKLLDIGDLDQALNAASAIGDDRIEKLAHQPINPETWTHGSSAQRVKWFRRGFDTGKFAACDTFSSAPP
jgi:predicted metalloprotease